MRGRRLPLIEAFEPGTPPEGFAGVLRHGPDGACVWLDRGTRLCVVHRDLGADALPVACRAFPRIARTGPTGVAITLSHYCPTAARLLLDTSTPLTVVESPPAFPPGAYDGLLADEWPPLLHARMLMDEAAYDAWEALAVWRCATAPGVWPALAALRRDAEALTGWHPGGPSLLSVVESRRARPAVAAPPLPVEAIRERVLDARAAAGNAAGTEPFLPEADGWAPALALLDAFSAPTRRFVAAHAFGTWCAYQGRGLLASVRQLETVVAVLASELARPAGQPVTDEDRFVAAVRATDYLLRHLASSQALADTWSRREGLLPASPAG